MPSSPHRSSRHHRSHHHHTYIIRDGHERLRVHHVPRSRSRSSSHNSHHSHHHSHADHLRRYRSRSRSRSRDSLYGMGEQLHQYYPESVHFYPQRDPLLRYPSAYPFHNASWNEGYQPQRLFAIRTRKDNRPKSERYSKEEVETCRHIFLGNLEFSVDNEIIKQEIGEELMKNVINVVSFQGGARPKGIAFVECKTHEDAEAVYNALKGRNVRGRILNVDWDLGMEMKGRGRGRPFMDESFPSAQDSTDFASSSALSSSSSSSSSSDEMRNDSEKEDQLKARRSRSRSQPSRSQSPEASQSFLPSPSSSESPVIQQSEISSQ
ncbi:uncharacterized protein MONOS_6195 [Monocercomonoides exilis]|uniref:uncharacterized protein n=1 Tax=Monocercomonoides exilis TaxID=2049356 RepID=UPI00355A8F28|nr:hypothetical protein MONOS_6195 [Monocercomonoides exilis]|eukprot:MONOS_6195.1-p1 / transcript=MONOS_6195.1 / gene=MONOS_6195 / organism=Monocercomonoides_exilis_PA203 / gene_product=unspecified product / transcript_product=unspecified product / location=Mono_scaffold00192:19174-20139(-) / protein_length=321 / sequence_SO=supercontig / SO=protein_coding / is_pseudo=false